MYLPKHFREDRLEAQHELVRTFPLGTLVTAGPGGVMANHVPFLLYADEGERGTLRAHVARANPQLAELAAVEECLVVFAGPEDYISPGWYASKREHGKVVPTWNFVAVHVWGRPRLFDDANWLQRQLEDLTNRHEHALPRPWAVDDAPADFIVQMKRALVGIELPIARSEGKWKLSQNRSAEDRAGVVAGLRAQGARGVAMAALIETATRRED
ncbi:MAG: FMN-binding negative transcriptional regulator [Gammaproteobacteria bacterium]